MRKELLPRCLALGLALLAAWLIGWALLHLVPLPAGLFRPAMASFELLDRNGQTLREVAGPPAAYARPVSLRLIPVALIQATVAAEDKRFWRHSGIDWLASARAAVGLVRRGRIVSGGSTITQQLIKLASPRPRTFRTKLAEALQARRLEQVWSKQRILEEYLNRLNYGNLCVGCAAAAQFYFGKPLADLSLAEATMLAGLPRAPTRLNPLLHFRQAKRRQDWVLGRLQASGTITPLAGQQARQEPLQFRPARRLFQAPHFVDLVMRLERGALEPARARSVRTTLDLNLNRVAEKILRDQLARLKPQHVGNGAVVVLDNRAGDVLALVGSENYFSPVGGQVNGAWAPRSAGSTFKPFTYLLALEQGATPATLVADVPTDFSTATGIFSPANYDHHCFGPIRYRLALANSLNIPAVKVLASVGGPALLLDKLRACGLTTLDQAPEHYGLGLTIGNAEARLLELANAYACLARLGRYKPYRLLAGNTSAPQAASLGPYTRTQVFAPDAAWLIADILSDNFARTPAFGAFSSLRFDFPVACKTGTSTDFRDNWALGYTPEFTVAVWVGNFDGTPMSRVSGVTGAAPIMHELTLHLHRVYGTSWYSAPPNLTQRWIHAVTGKLLDHPSEMAVREKFLAGCLPPRENPADYDAQHRIRLPAEYGNWFASSDNWLATRAVVEGASTAASLRLVSPLPGSTLYLDPDLPNQGRRLPLRAEGAAHLSWKCDSLECLSEGGQTYAILREGTHRITAVDPATGAEAKAWIHVKSL